MSRLLRKRYLPLVAALGAAVAVVPTLAVGASTGSIQAYDNYYAPSQLAVTPGGTVTFSYYGPSHYHDVHFDSASLPASCANNNPGVGSWVGPDNNGTGAPQSTSGSNNAWSSTCTFTQAGTYTFHCDVHGFSGTVYVNTAGTVPATTTTYPPPTTGTTTGTTPPPTTTTTTTTPGTNPGGGGGAGGGGAAPSAGSALSTVSLASIQKGASVRGSADIAQAGSTLTVDLQAASASLAKKHKAATASAGHLSRAAVGPGRVSFSVALNARARRAVRRHGRLALTVKVKVTAPGGATGTRTATSTCADSADRGGGGATGERATVPAVPSRTGLLGLGSNLGDRRAHLQAAASALPGAGLDVLASSSVYDTDPVGEVLDQPSFLNACRDASRPRLQPLELLDALKALEQRLGRSPDGIRHGPRAIDIDLLLLGDVELRHERLRLPHEQVLARRFVLIPALELDGDLAVPDGRRLADALAALALDEGVRWAGPPLDV